MATSWHGEEAAADLLRAADAAMYAAKTLAYLRRFPIDTLKIDRSFVASVERTPEDRALVHAIAQLGRTLQLCVVAEGVEREQHIEQLLDLGCGYGQGYHYAKPLPPAALAAYLAEKVVPRPRHQELASPVLGNSAVLRRPT